MKYLLALLVLCVCNLAGPVAHAEEIGCVSTTWRVVNNDKVCVQSFKDPDIDGIVCHVSYAQTGGISGALGFAEDPSRFSLACRQVGPLVGKKPIPKIGKDVFTHRMSFLFKGLNVSRLVDQPNHSLVYLVVSDKIVEGSPFNSISTVPLMPWGTVAPRLDIK
jgi:CreA protein